MCFDRGNFVVRDLSKYLGGGKISRHWKRSEFANPATDSLTGKEPYLSTFRVPENKRPNL